MQFFLLFAVPQVQSLYDARMLMECWEIFRVHRKNYLQPSHQLTVGHRHLARIATRAQLGQGQNSHSNWYRRLTTVVFLFNQHETNLSVSVVRSLEIYSPWFLVTACYSCYPSTAAVSKHLFLQAHNVILYVMYAWVYCASIKMHLYSCPMKKCGNNSYMCCFIFCLLFLD